MKQLIIPLLFSLNTVVCLSQPNDNAIVDLVDDLFALQSEDLSYDELYEQLLLRYLNPLDLNEATSDDLLSLYILSDLQIHSFILYRKKHGELLSLYELQAVPGYNKLIIEKLLPFVKINGPAARLPQLKDGNNYLLFRYSRLLSKSKGYSSAERKPDGTYPSRYIGSADNLYFRFRSHKAKNYSIGITSEKDAGEVIVWKPDKQQYGMDYYSYHLMLENRGKVKRVILGDYHIQFGQGLLLGSGFNIGKGAETVRTVRRNNLGIRPYTSVVERNYFRGAAATISFENLEVTGFYSHLKQDLSSSVINNLFSESEYSFNIRQTGYHRTPTEIEGKNAISEQVEGVNILYRSDHWQSGITYVSTHFSKNISKRPTLSNQFDFSGNSNHSFGAYTTYTWQNLSFFGEVGRSKSRGIGAVGGVIGSLSQEVDFSILYRHYGRNFHSFYGTAFGESSNVKNESGIYFGSKVKINQILNLTAYYDRFKFPWLRFGINRPSSGHEYLLRLNYTPSKKVKLFAQFREERKDRNINSDTLEISSVLQGVKRNYTFNISTQASKQVSLRTRFQFSTVEILDNTTGGFVLVQDLNISLRNLDLSSRLALFQTDDFDNRQYVFERNVLYSFSIPAYQGIGARQYIMAKWKPNRNLHIWLRYALSSFRDQQTIGSGLDEIDSNTKRDIRAQIMYKF